MTIYRSSGKNTEVYEEYELYTKEYVENVGGKSNFTAKGGTTIGENPKTAKPLEITNLYVKVRLAGEYKGEFGFDWVDVNPDTKEIEKIQDVLYSNVEYFYKEDPNGLGNIVEKSTDEMGAKHAIQKHYEFSPISKYVDIPYVLLMPTKKAVLSAEIILWQGAINEDVVSITGDEFYEFTIIGGEKEGKTAKKKVTAAGKIEFTVECLKPGAIDKTYEFKHSNPITGSHAVGGVRMMENKVLKLKFRVIALVSSDDSPSDKAKALFQKFKKNGITDYLNENSLNQAGYKVEIENQEMFTGLDTADVDDYLYAFDKADWISKKYFENIIKQKPDVIPGTNTCKAGSWDSVNNKCATIPVSTDVISEDLEIDFKTIDFYKQKLKNKSKLYEGGIIILSDYESPSQTAAFSRTSPLDHYALFVYSNAIEKKENYSHEIGHMLGLEHFFYTDKEKEAYKNARENIFGNGLPQKNPDGTDNKKYRAGINKNIQKVKDDAKAANLSDIYRPLSVTAIKNDIIKYLQNFNNIYSTKLIQEKNDKKRIETTYVNYHDNDKINQTQTKGQYLSIYNKNIKNWTDYIEENKKAIIEVNKYKGNKFETIKTDMNFIRPNYILLLEETKMYYLSIITQVHSNYIMFKKTTTKNIMDYENEKLRYLHNQIRIMRNDIKNY